MAEKWTFLLQDEFAHQGEMERQIGMETTLFGGPPEIGNILKLANGQIGFMTIFAHPLFEAVTDIMPGMRFATDEISKNKTIWSTKAEQEKRRDHLRRETGMDPGLISPRTQSPAAPQKRSKLGQEASSSDYFARSPLKNAVDANFEKTSPRELNLHNNDSDTASPGGSRRSSLVSPAGVDSTITSSPDPSRSSSGDNHASKVHAPSYVGVKSSSSQSQLSRSKDETQASNSKLRRHSSENIPSHLRGGSEEDDFMGTLAADAFPRRQEAGRSSVPLVKSDKKLRGEENGADLSSMFTSPSTSDGADRDTRTSDQQSTSVFVPSVLSLESHSDTSKSSIRVDVRNGNGNGNGNGTKTVPRRRSRLRLAFWRKRNGSDNDT